MISDHSGKKLGTPEVTIKYVEISYYLVMHVFSLKVNKQL